MKRKILAALSATTVFTGMSAAQISGEGSGVFASITDILSTIIGVETLSPTNMFYFAIGLGIIWVTLTIILQKGLDELGLSSVFTDAGYGSEGSNRMLYVLSLLLTLMMVGTGAITGLIAGLQSFFLLAVGSIVIALLIAALFGLPSGALFGLGAGAKALGKASSFSGVDGGSAKKAAETAGKGFNKAKNLVQKAEEEMKEVEKEEKEAKQKQDAEEAEHAAKVEEEAEKDLEQAENITENILEQELQQLDDTLDEARKELNMERNEEEILKGMLTSYRALDDRLKAYAQGLKQRMQSGQNPKWNVFKRGDYARASNLPDNVEGTDVPPAELERTILRSMLEDTKKLRKVQKNEESLLRDEMKRLRQETKELMDAVSISKELGQDLEKMKKEEKGLEKLGKKLNDRSLVQEVNQEEQELKKMMNLYQQIQQEEKQVEEKLEEVEQFLNKEINIMEGTINKLQEEVQDSEQIEQEMEQLRNIVNTDGVFNKDKTKRANQLIDNWEEEIEQIESNIQTIAKRKKQEKQEAQKLGKHVKSHLSQHFD